MSGDDESQGVERLLDTQNLAEALGSDRFKQFLDQIPFGVAVAELSPEERIVYVNLEFERLTGEPADQVVGRDWRVLSGIDSAGDGAPLAEAVTRDSDHIGLFESRRDDGSLRLDAWSSLIQGDDGEPVFRLVALVKRAPSEGPDDEDLQRALELKDFELQELQHRVKNNLQLITSLIRFEARRVPDRRAGDRFDSLAGRVEALAVLYRSLTQSQHSDTVDLGVYLSEVASSVMKAHATEGIRLDLQVDTWPVSVNVAMPTGLIVNELLTNSLKHAFRDRDGGAIHVHSLVDEVGCRVVVADDGVGLPPDGQWPMPGRLSALFVRSLQQNANADISVRSEPGKGVTVEILFARADAAPGDSGSEDPGPEDSGPDDASRGDAARGDAGVPLAPPPVRA
jgi:two-component sensor histidine kinase